MALDFFKGQMGGNRIVLLDGRQLSAEQVDLARRIALTALDENHLHGHQAGILSPSDQPDHLRVRVVSLSWRDYIPACGGLTQVLGKALGETGLAERFGLELVGEAPRVNLDFDAWPVPLTIHRQSGGAAVTRVDADLTAFVHDCRQRRIGPVELDGTEAMQVGTFLVLDADRVRARYGDLDLEQLATPGPAHELLTGLHRRFQQVIGLQAWDFALYDRPGAAATDGQVDLRAVFPHSLPIGHIEPACGTGSVAIALAVAHAEPGAARQLRFRLETGGEPTLGGPDCTTVDLQLKAGRAEAVSFHHDNVTITAVGQLQLGNVG